MNSKSATRFAFGCLVVALALSTRILGRAADHPGQSVYDRQCSQCHGPEGRGRGTVAPSLIPFDWSYEEALELIRHPVCNMPPIPESKVSDAEVAQIVAYLKTIK